MLKSIIILMLLFSSIFSAAPTGMTPDEIRKSFEQQDTDKFKLDSFETAQPHRLIEGGILKASFTTTQGEATTIDCGSFVNTGWTSSIYAIDALSGSVTCMFSEKNNLYEIQGLFNVFYPKLKENFALNTDLAKQQNASIISQKNEMIKSLIDVKKEISNSITADQGNYLNITQLITAGVLADPTIIDAAATETTGKLQLKGDFTSQYTTQTEITDNGYIIKSEISNIFKTYSAVSSTIFDYLFLILLFIGLFTAGRMVLAKLDKHQKQAPLHFFAIALLGFIAFFPAQDGETTPGQNEYAIISSNFQSLSRRGFHLFSELGDTIAKKITDNTLDTLLNKSGIGSSNQIIAAYTGMQQTQKLIDYHANFKTACSNTYDKQYLDESFGTPNSIYPNSETWAQAIAIYKPTAGRNYYNKSPEGLVKGDSVEGSYPQLSFSFCNRNDKLFDKYTKLFADYSANYNGAIETDPNADQKILILTALTRFQYQLYRDYGYLSILGLPVIQLQTDNIGKLYQKDDVAKKMDERIGDSDGSSAIVNSLVSSIPYMFLPGSGTVYGSITQMLRDIFSGAKSTVWGMAAGLIGGNIVAGVAANSLAFSLSYGVMKIMLSLLPIAGIIVIGLLRFITIIIKIFAFNFGSLLVFPIVLAQQNAEIMGKFTVKILLLMLEIPFFVLSIWLAITANSLLHAMGDVFSKEIILGMLANNQAGVVHESWSLTSLLSITGAFFDSLKIYFLNGLMEIAITLFSIIIIYVIIISLHKALFEALELKSTEVLDNAVASVRQEANMGAGKI